MYNFDQAWKTHISQVLDYNHSRAVAVNTLLAVEQVDQTATQRRFNRIQKKRQQRRKYRRLLGIGAVTQTSILMTGAFLSAIGLLPVKVLVLPVLSLLWLYRLATIRR